MLDRAFEERSYRDWEALLAAPDRGGAECCAWLTAERVAQGVTHGAAPGLASFGATVKAACLQDAARLRDPTVRQAVIAGFIGPLGGPASRQADATAPCGLT